MRRQVRVFCVCVSLLGLCGGLLADTLVTRDGRTFQGEVLSKSASRIVFEAHKFGSKITLTFPVRDVASLTKGKIEPASKPAKPTVRVKPKKRQIGESPPLLPAPPIKKYSGPTYYVIPLTGTVGQTLSANVLEKSLADAAKRKPTVVVLHVDSPGGLIGEVELLIKSIRKNNKKLRIVVLVKKALSAAAITSLACKEIYMESTGIIGAATAFRMTVFGMPVDIQEKMQSVWRASARSSAEIGGHSPLLANAMIDAEMELYLTEQNGKKVVKTGRGKDMISKRGRLLTMTAGEAIRCGLSNGTADDFEELAKLLGFQKWTECEGHGRILAAHRKETIKVLTEDMEKLRKEYNENMAMAGANVPWNAHYQYYARTGRFTRSSWQRWRKRSKKCSKHLLKAENALSKSVEIAEKIPAVASNPAWILRQKDSIKAIRTQITQESRKRGP